MPLFDADMKLVFDAKIDVNSWRKIYDFNSFLTRLYMSEVRKWLESIFASFKTAE